MKLCDDSQDLSKFVQIDDAYLGGKRKGGKRGRGAEGKTPFVAAIMTNDKGHPISMRFSVVAGFHKNGISNWAQKHLLPRTSVVSDGLNSFFLQSKMQVVVTMQSSKMVAQQPWNTQSSNGLIR